MFFKKNLQSTSKLAICFTKWIASFEADCKIFEKKHAIRFKTRNRKLLQDTTMYVCIVCKVYFFRIDQFQKSLIDVTVKDFTVKKRQNVRMLCTYVLIINYVCVCTYLSHTTRPTASYNTHIVQHPSYVSIPLC